MGVSLQRQTICCDTLMIIGSVHGWLMHLAAKWTGNKRAWYQGAFCSFFGETVSVWLFPCLGWIPLSLPPSAPNQMKSKERRSPGRSSRYDDYDRDSRRRRSRSRSYERYRSRSPSYDRHRRRSESPREWVHSSFSDLFVRTCFSRVLNCSFRMSFFSSRGRMYGRGRSRSREDDRYSSASFRGRLWMLVMAWFNLY